MAKTSKAKHLQARVSFLEQAAKYLAGQTFVNPAQPSDASDTKDASEARSNMGGALLLVSQLRTVAKRSQIRLDRNTKRSVCKICSTPFTTATSTTSIVNVSKGKAKPWADVQTITCLNCSVIKRFPVGATRQKKRASRTQAVKQPEPASKPSAD